MKTFLIIGAFLFFYSFFISISAIPLPTNVDVVSEEKQGQNGIIRSYVPNGVLTSVEEAIILDLAKKRGIERVAKIVTHYMLPSSAKAIRWKVLPRKRVGRFQGKS